MAYKYNIKCSYCDKKESFNDTKDITFAKWKILGWNVDPVEPICICNKCEYQYQEPLKNK